MDVVLLFKKYYYSSTIVPLKVRKSSKSVNNSIEN